MINYAIRLVVRIPFRVAPFVIGMDGVKSNINPN